MAVDYEADSQPLGALYPRDLVVLHQLTRPNNLKILHGHRLACECFIGTMVCVVLPLTLLVSHPIGGNPTYPNDRCRGPARLAKIPQENTAKISVQESWASIDGM